MSNGTVPAYDLWQGDTLPEQDAGEATRTHGVAEDPDVVIGRTDTNALFNVRGILLAGSGETVIADGGSREIRVFDRTGQLSRSFGRRGEGPGEFADLTAARLIGDTVIVYDQTIGRVTWFTLDGEWIRDQPLIRPVVAIHDFLGTFRGRPISLAMGTIVAPETRAAPVPTLLGARRDTLHLLSFDPDGEKFTTLVRAPGREVYGAAVMMEGGRSVVQVFFGFQRTGLAATDGTILVYGATDRPRLVIDRDGDRRAIHWGTEAEAFSEKYLAVLIDTVEAQIASGRADPRTRLMLEEMPKPATLPAFDRLLIGSDASIWVRLWAWPDAATRIWRVLGSEGQETAKVHIPSAYDVRAVAADRIAVLHRGEFDVETVSIHRIRPE